jgi:2-polyprenyl-3-methyl-5-hydroxy-6-metoxy-1,4-benzoquinol methylase
MRCRICENQSGNKEYKIREMMFDLGEEFVYFECASCGCLQIAEIPEKMEKYYPSTYISFVQDESGNSIKQILKRKRNEYAVFHSGIVGRLIYFLYRNVQFNIDIIKGLNISRDSKILDVGCGSGRFLLYPLSRIGCRDLLGVDPYIKTDISDGDVRIRKLFIHDLPDDELFDIVVLSHTLEHIPDQKETLEKAGRLLSKNGVCLVRIPVKNNYIWNRYGVNWIQIDAPRHFFIHTTKSFGVLADKAGLKIRDVVFDSNDLQFWGSEQYVRGIPYTAENSYFINPKKSIFSKSEIKTYKKMAKELNSEKEGDQAAFHLVKA